MRGFVHLMGTRARSSLGPAAPMGGPEPLFQEEGEMVSYSPSQHAANVRMGFASVFGG